MGITRRELLENKDGEFILNDPRSGVCWVEGSILKLYRDDGSNSPWFVLKGAEEADHQLISLARLSINTPSLKKKANTVHEYQFKTACVDSIDWNELSKECTKNNPLILVETKATYSVKIKALKKKIHFLKNKHHPKDQEQEINEIITKLEGELEKLLNQDCKPDLFLSIHYSLLEKAKATLQDKIFKIDEFFDQGIYYTCADNTHIIEVNYSMIPLYKQEAIRILNTKWPTDSELEVKVKGLL